MSSSDIQIASRRNFLRFLAATQQCGACTVKDLDPGFVRKVT